jgi:hypothetical protein
VAAVRVTLNLLDNAVKYSTRGGIVTLNLNRKNGAPGIPNDLQDRVFERFFRVDKPGRGPRASISPGVGPAWAWQLPDRLLRHMAEALPWNVRTRVEVPLLLYCRARCSNRLAAAPMSFGFYSFLFDALNERSTMSCTSVDTPWSRQSQRSISGNTVASIF